MSNQITITNVMPFWKRIWNVRQHNYQKEKYSTWNIIWQHKLRPFWHERIKTYMWQYPLTHPHKDKHFCVPNAVLALGDANHGKLHGTRAPFHKVSHLQHRQHADTQSSRSCTITYAYSAHKIKFKFILSNQLHYWHHVFLCLAVSSLKTSALKYTKS